MTDIRDQLAQIRSILDDIDPRPVAAALKGRRITTRVLGDSSTHPCPAEYTCKECAFGIRRG